MEDKNLERALRSIANQLTSFDYINSGGCCYIAYLLAKQLERRKIPFKVIFEHPEKTSKSVYISQSKNLTRGLGVSPVFLRIYDVYYDSTGFKGTRMHTDKLVLDWNSKQLHNFWMNGRWNFLFKAKH